MRRLAFLLLAALAFPCYADDWTREDTYGQAALTALLVVDWGQTRWIVKHPMVGQAQSCASGGSIAQIPCNGGSQQRAESNPILGEHPSIGKVNNLIAASIVGHAAIAYLLPRGWREGWQYVWIGIEAGAVYHNRSGGVKLNF